VEFGTPRLLLLPDLLKPPCKLEKFGSSLFSVGNFPLEEVPEHSTPVKDESGITRFAGAVKGGE